jgi:hypothetical protein
MSGAAHNLDQEFWRPPAQTLSSPAGAVSTEVCPRCNTDFVVGARYCHVCGTAREPQPEITTHGLTRYLDFHFIRESLGQTIGSLVAFLAGVVCLIITGAIGVMYTATTTLDWQAIQVWRVQWLLAAIAAFLAGLLLKRA